ncbi:sugar ABC transporter permease [Pumilibacter intestinalis]|uniref:sugar ABC transporter permease n=1 Tax=Pumilibacter intestinalis TaxID=2941511 RepID=UPI00203EEA7B|nr:sugar ABC transporter permease [Pumilibacter intestinalis]
MRKSMKRRRIAGNIIAESALIILSVIWLIPIVWIVLQAFRKESGALTYTFFPQELTLGNFATLFKNTMFGRWFLNTFLVAIASCVLSTIITLMVAYAMSRFRFKARKPFMKIALVLGMFPGFMSMIAVYYILKAFGLDGQLVSLVLVYSGGAGLGFYVAKGFFDTVSKSLDESARLEGASSWKVFWKIIVPMSKPIIVYTALMAFISPWSDFIFAKVILGTNRESYTVAIGLFELLDSTHKNTYFTCFAAGSILVAVPVMLLFIFLQKYYVEGIAGGSVKG